MYEPDCASCRRRQAGVPVHTEEACVQEMWRHRSEAQRGAFSHGSLPFCYAIALPMEVLLMELVSFACRSAGHLLRGFSFLLWH